MASSFLNFDRLFNLLIKNLLNYYFTRSIIVSRSFWDSQHQDAVFEFRAHFVHFGVWQPDASAHGARTPLAMDVSFT